MTRPSTCETGFGVLVMNLSGKEITSALSLEITSNPVGQQAGGSLSLFTCKMIAGCGVDLHANEGWMASVGCRAHLIGPFFLAMSAAAKSPM